MIDISQKGKGAIPTPQDLKSMQYIFSGPLGDTEPIDWEKGFMVEDGFEIPQANQQGSGSCTAQAAAYYGEALNKKYNDISERYSRRFIYSQCYIPPDGGAYIWKAMSIPVIKGFASMDSVWDEPSTEAHMRDGSDNAKAIIEATALKYAQLQNTRDMDYLARLIKKHSGYVTGFHGRDDMFNPDGGARIIVNPVWGHCVWICGFGMRNGQKVLIYKNSWGKEWGTNGYGYFSEDFVKSGLLFDAYIYAELKDIKQPMLERISCVGEKDQYTLREGKIKQIPDLETLEMLVEEGVVGSTMRDIEEKDFNKLIKAEPWPSVKVNRLARTFFDGARDAFIAE